MSKTPMRVGVAVVGFIVLIVGIAAFGYGVPAVLFGYTYSVTNPYRDEGIALIVVGIVILVLGAVTRGGASAGPPPDERQLISSTA